MPGWIISFNDVQSIAMINLHIDFRPGDTWQEFVRKHQPALRSYFTYDFHILRRQPNL